jgi:non-ribosomal peptide synthetase component F
LSDYKRTDILTHEHTSQRFCKTFSKDYFENLIERSKEDGLTIKGLMFGAFLYSISLLTNEDEVTAGLVTNNRPLKEDSEKVLGCFLNTIPFRYKTQPKYINMEKLF